MKISGLQAVSLIDFPEHICCTVFTQGCNFKCPYCHNPELLSLESKNKYIEEKDFFKFLTERRGKLDGVCITGGEPTLQGDLTSFIEKIKNMGFDIKIDTNGTNPELVSNLINKNLVDYFAMDMKAPRKKYDEVSKSKNLLEKVHKSIKIIMNSKIQYEFRTTVVKELLSINDLKQIAIELDGSTMWIIQQFQPFENIKFRSPKFTTYSHKQLMEVVKFATDYIETVNIR